MSSLIVPYQGGFTRYVPRSGAIAALMFLLVGCGSQAVVEPPPQEPASSSAQEIVNGTDTTIGANPWQVMLYFDRRSSGGARWICGGSILNENWILTAQHCVRDPQRNLVAPDLVAAGSTTLSGVNHSQVRYVAQLIPYPGFVDTAEGKDVALLRLTTPLDLSDPNVKAIRLVTPVDESSRVTTPGVVARATGWGSRYIGDHMTDTLQTTDLIIQNNSVAQAAYPAHTITADQLTASALGTGICDGDSGGPITVLDGDTRALAGVISWGYGCGDARYPVMSARVSSFESWITSTTCILSNGATQSNISVPLDTWSCTYTLSVPEGARDLTFELSDGDGDGDLYVKFGSEPDFASHDCRPYQAGNAERRTISNPSVGTYYVKIRGFLSASGMRLKAGYSTLLDFGGMWGYVDGGVPMNNPATGSTTCPTGYKSTQLLGTPGVDWPVFFCSRPSLGGNEQALDFGGMWSSAQNSGIHIVKPNPYTDGTTCPPGYLHQRVLGSAGLDAELYYCFRRNMSKSPPEYPFGGMWGQVNGGTYVPNPSTGGLSCPSGYTAKDMLGTPHLDYQLIFCSTMN